ERGFADRQYNELGDRYWPDSGAAGGIAANDNWPDYPDNLRRSAGRESAPEPDSAEQVKYYLPQGDLRESAGDHDRANIDYPMYRSQLSGNSASSESLSAEPGSGQPVAIKKDISTQKDTGREKQSKSGAEPGVEPDYGRSNWQDRSNGFVTKGVKDVGTKGEQLSLFAEYKPFPLSLLNADRYSKPTRENVKTIKEMSRKLEDTLQSFGVEAKVTNYTSGPTLTRFELTPGLGVKVSRIVSLSDDIALNLAAYGVRIEAPIPGKSAIGIEIPNRQTQPVLLRGILEEPSFKIQCQSAPLLSVIGRDVSGQPIYCDIAKMPHLLIAGATGSGKSVCINSILISLLNHSSPQNLRLLLIDPKVVELSVYNGIPHLLQPVVTDPKKAFGVLNWAVMEMDRRYNLFAERQVRDIQSYNEVIKHFADEEPEYLPLVLIVIDELADLMATTSNEVEDAIQRLMAKARAAGIHVIIATQRPSVDVITGVIKANIPSRIAFSVASQVDSRTILDTGGAEKLLGKGDLLYFPQSAPKAMRGQGAFVTDAEVENVLNHIRSLYGDNYDPSVAEAIANPSSVGATAERDAGEEQDELFDDALRLVVETGYASISLLQRRLTIGYPRAARLVDRLHDCGYIGPFDGSKPRKVLISMEQYLAMREGENI
ncbi:MAG: DNA translocase FtsK, partial [Clostridiales bacterium]|nr:DNA translocase FtsK [Clostridiales bacterium]